ncbi:MAG: hypothetical protein H0W81_04090 [Chloroflexi bacterium]|nr:hypothetical protein [Chloroflexota bacterium]
MNSRFVAASLIAAALVLLAPIPVWARALGGIFTLPVPLALYLVAAGATVAVSFVVAVVLVRPAGPVARYPTRPLSMDMASRSLVALQVIGLLWWFGTILLGLVVDPISPFPAVLFWIGIWVGLPIICVLFANPWPALSPFRTVFTGLKRLARLIGFDRLDAALRYPARLGRWPATLLLVGGVWAELILPGSHCPEHPRRPRAPARAARSAHRPILAGLSLVALMIGYTVLSLWIIALPITQEPGHSPATALVRGWT